MKAYALNRPKVRENVSAPLLVAAVLLIGWKGGSLFVDQSQSVTSINEKDRDSVSEKWSK